MKPTCRRNRTPCDCESAIVEVLPEKLFEYFPRMSSPLIVYQEWVEFLVFKVFVLTILARQNYCRILN